LRLNSALTFSKSNPDFILLSLMLSV
jgi:hypothetical protein